MEQPLPEDGLPPIPSKRYFTIGEVGVLCAVKPHVLRYWEQEFSQLKPVKRRGNRRYYQPHEVLLIRQIRNLLYDQGFTINGARLALATPLQKRTAVASPQALEPVSTPRIPSNADAKVPDKTHESARPDRIALKEELIAIIALLSP